MSRAMTADGLIALHAADCAWAAEVLVRAYARDPIYCYVFPEAERREKGLRALWRAVIGYSRVHGEAFADPSRAGIAGWVAPGNTDFTLRKHLRAGFAIPRAVAGFRKEERQRFLALLDRAERVRKELAPWPYWYLWVLGVEPSSRGQGIGGRLIAPVLARADAQGLRCYLETETESNVAFYEKRGFVVARYWTVPGQDLSFWAMVREPRQGAAGGCSTR